MQKQVFRIYFFVLLFVLGIGSTSYSQISISPKQHKVCLNDSVIFRVINVSYTSATFLWQDSTASGWSNLVNSASIFGVTNDTLTIRNISSLSNGVKYRCIIDSAGLGTKKDTTAFSLLIVRTALVSPTIFGDQLICKNSIADTIHINVYPSGGDTTFSYQWQSSANGIAWANIVGAIDTFLKPGVISSTKHFRLLATSLAGCGVVSSNTVVVQLFDTLHRAHILGNQNLCFGTSANDIRVAQHATGGNNSFSYQWQKSSNSISWTNIVGATDTFLIIDTFTHTTYFRTIATSLSGCGSIPSDTILVRFYGKVKAAKTTAKKNYQVCYLGTANPDSIAVLTPPSGGNGLFHHQWQISTDTINWVDMPNDTNLITNPIVGITANFCLRLLSTSYVGCGTVLSDTSFIRVLSPMLIPTILGTQTVCFNEDPDTLKITANPLLGSDVTYQWQSSINGSTWTDIVGKTTKILVLAKNGVTKFYRVKTTWRNCGVRFTDSVLVSVYQNMLAGTIKSAQTICYNSTPTILSFQVLPSGAGDNFSYQWQISTDSLNFSDIPLATNIVYAPTILTQTRFYRVRVISNFGCGNFNTNIIRIKVYPIFNGSNILANDTICYNTRPDTIRTSNNPSGGSGSFLYQWQNSTNGISWQNVSGQTLNKYRPLELTLTTHYRLISMSTLACGEDTSNVITIKVWPKLVKAKINASQNICYNTSADTLRVTQLAQGANNLFSYQWQLSSDGTNWSNILGQNALKLFTGKLTSTKYYRIVATSIYGCSSIASDSVKIFVYDQLLPAIVSYSQAVCYDSIPKLFKITTKPTGANGLYTYQWQISNDSLNFLDLLGATDTVLQMNRHIINKFYRLRVTSVLGCGNVLSNIIKVQVYKKFVGGKIGNSVKVCYGYVPVPLYMTQKPKGGSGVYDYQWQSSIDSVNWFNIQGQIADTLPMVTLLQTSYFRLLNSSTFSCGRDTSNMVTIFSLKLPDTTEVNGLSEVCRNQQELYYNLEHKSSEYSYEWSISKGTILTNETKTNVFITWDNTSGNDTIFVKQTNKETGCFNYMTLPILLKESIAPNITQIIRKSTTNILVSKDSTIGIHYQWGYIDKATQAVRDIPGANLRYVQLPHTFDTTRYFYYVKTWFDDCATTTYYNFDPLSMGVKKQAIKHVKIYPNPSSGVFTLDGVDLGSAQIKSFDILGNEISIEISINDNSISFNPAQLDGVYIIYIKTSEGVSVERIILNRK